MRDLVIGQPLPFTHNTILIFQSPPEKVGKTYWKVVAYTIEKASFDFDNNAWVDCTVNDYVYWDGYNWLHSKHHPRYKPHDGVYAGLPKGLRALYEKYEKSMFTPPAG